tara:strand:+ start:22209 stop:22499 length:291 start_codon:yes stop_codon:yes gene_type:complete
MSLTILELRDLLNDYIGDGDGDLEVRIMEQENWPFECEVSAVATREEIVDELGDDEQADECAEDSDDDDNDNYLYIIDGEQLRYGMKSAWDMSPQW